MTNTVQVLPDTIQYLEQCHKTVISIRQESILFVVDKNKSQKSFSNKKLYDCIKKFNLSDNGKHNAHDTNIYQHQRCLVIVG